MAETQDPDFIEFQFRDADDAIAAERLFPTDVVNLGTSLALRVGEVERLGDGIRTKLAASGLAYTETPSALTEEDMWPEDWPDSGDPDGDENDGGDDDFQPEVP